MFKIFVRGDGSGNDLMQWMQPTGNLQMAQIMFDHVKLMEGWMTLTCHVYHLFYCKVMTIVKCDLKFENKDVQCVMWQKLNKVMAKKILPNSNFKGFIVDNV